MASSTNEPVSGDDKKLKRKRNKKLLGSIRQQLEFYFSDANLRKDRFLRQEMELSEEGYVDVATITSFNKMQVMCPDPALIPQAIGASDLLVLSEDKTKVRRKEPLGEPEFDPDDVTVYVESLPKTVDHDWLRKVFGVCGSVEYVSLPRYRSTGDIKGFAFIEFKTPDEASRACEMLHKPGDDDTERMGRFPKTVGRKYVPIEENNERHAEDHERGQASAHDRKITHRDDDDRGHQDSHASQKRKQRDSESSDRLDSSKHGEPHRSQKRKHRDSESSRHHETSSGQKRKHRDSDRTDSSRHRETHSDQKRKHRDSELSDKPDDSAKHGTNQEHKKRRNEGQRSEMDNLEKQLQEKHDVKKDRDTLGSTKTDSNESSQHSKSKDREPRKRPHVEGKSLSQDSCIKKNKLDGESTEDGKSNIHTSETMERSEQKRTEAKTEKKEHKRKHAVDTEKTVSDKDQESRKSKKRTHNDSDSLSEAKKSRVGHDSLDDEKSKGHDLSSDDEDGSENHEEEGETRKDADKRRRVRKRKQEKKRDSKENDLHLRVISKREWLELKKQYLSLQKASLAKMKRSLYQSTMDSIAKSDSNEKLVKSTEPEFTAGVVLKIESKKPIDSRKQLKDDFQREAPVAYIDLQPGDQDGFVRCETTEGAKQILTKYGADAESDDVTVSLLTGEEEKQYWDKLRTDRINKLNSKQKKKKKRGVDRLLCKADKVSFNNASKGTHVFFEEDD